MKTICRRLHMITPLNSETCQREICEIFVYKQSETKNMLKISLILNKSTNFTRKKLENS